MKKIYVDLSSTQPYKSIKINGGGQYAELIFRMLCEKADTTRIIALLDNRKGENLIISDILNHYKVDSKRFDDETEFSNILSKVRDSVVFIPVCYPKYSKIRCDKSNLVITTIHDMSSVYADMCNYIVERKIGESKIDCLKQKYLRKILIKKHIKEHIDITNISENQVIITDSIFSMDQLLKYTKTNKKINVLYPAFQLDHEKQSLKNNSFEKKDNFVLLVSASRWHKNNYFALKAIDEEIGNRNTHFMERRYIIIGADSVHIDFYTKNLKNLDYFTFLDYTSRGQYAWYMKKAEAFIYPSLFEGFGVPPVEAMENRTIPICSNATCIPEICGEGALYFDPYNDGDFKRTFEMLDEKKHDLLQKGEERIRYINRKQIEDTEYLLNMLLHGNK